MLGKHQERLVGAPRSRKRSVWMFAGHGKSVPSSMRLPWQAWAKTGVGAAGLSSFRARSFPVSHSGGRIVCQGKGLRVDLQDVPVVWPSSPCIPVLEGAARCRAMPCWAGTRLSSISGYFGDCLHAMECAGPSDSAVLEGHHHVCKGAPQLVPCTSESARNIGWYRIRELLFCCGCLSYTCYGCGMSGRRADMCRSRSQVRQSADSKPGSLHSLTCKLVSEVE